MSHPTRPESIEPVAYTVMKTEASAEENMRHEPRNSRRTASQRLMHMAGW